MKRRITIENTEQLVRATNTSAGTIYTGPLALVVQIMAKVGKDGEEWLIAFITIDDL